MVVVGFGECAGLVFIFRMRCLVCSLLSRVEVHWDVSAQCGALPPGEDE